MNENKRLESLDAFRGFDMMWIMGASSILVAICSLFPGGENCFLVQQMDHVKWHGLAFMDLIFPTFLFIAGISFPFSFARQRERGDSSLRMHLKVLKRAALLVVLGLVYNGSLNGEAWPFRWASVLGRIGLTWMLAAFVYMHTGVRTRLLLVAALLAGYWAVLLNCVSPLAPAGASPLSLEGCFMGFLDTFLTPGTFWEKGIFEPSGVPMSVVSVGTALLGMTAGDSAGAGQNDAKVASRAFTELYAYFDPKDDGQKYERGRAERAMNLWTGKLRKDQKFDGTVEEETISLDED